MVNLLPQTPLARLLLGYAPASARAHHARAWVLDERLAAILQGGREPGLMAIRLAWWRDALAEGDLSKGKGEPLIEAFRAAGLSDFDRQAIGRCIDGWAQIAGAEDLGAEDLRAYALGRGGGLFTLLAADAAPGLIAAGAVWALWDLAAHVSDARVAQACLAEAGRFLPEVRWHGVSAPRPVRLAFAVAMADVRAGRVPQKGFTLRHYARILIGGILH